MGSVCKRRSSGYDYDPNIYNNRITNDHYHHGAHYRPAYRPIYRDRYYTRRRCHSYSDIECDLPRKRRIYCEEYDYPLERRRRDYDYELDIRVRPRIRRDF